MANGVRPDGPVLRELQDQLVKRAEDLALGLKLDERAGRLANSQAAKAVEVAEEAETPRVFLNWAHYQAGRRDSELFWKCPLQDGSPLVQHLGRELGWVEQEVARRVPEEARPATTRRAAALLLGYFRRALIGLEALRAHQNNVKPAPSAAGGKK
jgi:hypothetical protein